MLAPALPSAASDRLVAPERRVQARGPKTKNLIPKVPAPKPTRYDRAVSRIRADGSTSLANAKRLFSMVVAALPGVDVPVARSALGLDALTSIEVILAHFDELSNADREIVRHSLVLPEPITGAANAAFTGTERATAREADLDTAQLAALLAEVTPAVAARLGPAPADIRIEAGPEFRGEIFATAGLDAAGVCRILALPLLNTLSASGQRFVVAHELVHCYAYARHGEQVPVPEWIREGGADFVAATSIYGAQPGPLSGLEEHWPRYLRQPTLSTYQRSYDGIGIFAFGEAHGVDAARVALDSSYAFVDSPAVLTTLLAGATDDWPGGWWRRAEWGGAWVMTGPGITPDRAEASDAVLRPGRALRVNLPAGSAGVGRVRFGSELLTVEEASRGNARLDDGTTRTIASLGGTTWCTGGVCECPRGTRQAGRTFPRLAGSSMVLGITGGTDPARFEVRGRSLRDECHREPLACLVGSWTASRFTSTLFGVRSGGAGVRMQVQPDHTFRYDYSPMDQINATVTGVNDLVLHVRLDGVATGRWAVDGDRVSATELDASAVRSSGSAEFAGATAITISGSVEDLIASAGTQGESAQPEWLALDCTSSALRLSHPLGEWSFTRDA